MIQPLVDQHLYLAEQYVHAQAFAEAFALVEKLTQPEVRLSPKQQTRVLDLLVALEADAVFIAQFEAGVQVESRYLPALIQAYGRSGAFEQAFALCEQVADSQLVDQLQAQLHSLQAQADEQRFTQLMLLLQREPVAWEQVVALIQQAPTLFSQESLKDQLEAACSAEQIPAPQLAFLIDLASTQGIRFHHYPDVVPMMETPWVQQLIAFAQTYPENPGLMQELATWQICHLYPRSLAEAGFADVAAVQADLIAQLHDLLAGGGQSHT